MSTGGISGRNDQYVCFVSCDRKVNCIFTIVQVYHITIKKGRCKRCFEFGHLAFNCKLIGKCGICQDPNHHTVLHIPDPQTDETYSDDAESVHTDYSQSYENEDDNEN